MNRYTVTMEFDVVADNPQDARRKVHDHVFRNDPLPPFNMPQAHAALGAEIEGGAENELPWSPTGPGCTALT